MGELSLLNALLLGLVEGVTEFLPVSSTGHLIVVGHWLGERGDVAKAFEIFIQLGAILAVCWHYRRVFIAAIIHVPTDAGARHFLASLLVAFMPAAVVGLIAHRWIKTYLFNPGVVGVSLVAGGALMLVIERLHRQRAGRMSVPEIRADRLGLRTAFGIGLAQVLALVPGVSRSGATIMGGIALGLPRETATEFSFFLAVPVMIAATLFDLLSSRNALTTADAPAFALGLLVAFVTALLVIRLFLRWVARHDFTGFAWYRILFGTLLLLFFRGNA